MEYSEELIQIIGEDKVDKKLSILDFKMILSARIGYLMQHNHQFLFNIFYRIDLFENKVKEALKLPTDIEVYNRLADLVIEREAQRQETRKKYSQKNKLED